MKAVIEKNHCLYMFFQIRFDSAIFSCVCSASLIELLVSSDQFFKKSYTCVGVYYGIIKKNIIKLSLDVYLHVCSIAHSPSQIFCVQK